MRLNRNLVTLFAGLSLLAATTASAAEYSNGYLWNRSQQWTGGSVPGTTLGNPDDDTLGNPVWTHAISEGGSLLSANPWYKNQHTLLVWDDYWYGNGGSPVWARGYAGPESSPSENLNLNPPISRWAMTHDVSVDFLSWQYVPQVRWTNPVGDGAIIDVFTYSKNPIIVEWAGGNGQSPNFEVEFALAKFDASSQATELLYSTTVANPSPNSANPPFASIGIPLSVRGLRMDQGDELIYSIRTFTDGAVGLNWVNLYDHPFYIKLVSVVPEPASYMYLLLGIPLLVGFRRLSR